MCLVLLIISPFHGFYHHSMKMLKHGDIQMHRHPEIYLEASRKDTPDLPTLGFGLNLGIIK